MTKEEYLAKLVDPDSQKYLFNIVNQYVFGRHNVEDIVQDTNLKIIEKYSNYQEKGKFKQWIYSIAYWTAKSYLKKTAISKVEYCDCSSVEEGVSLSKDKDLIPEGSMVEPEVLSVIRESELLLEELDIALNSLSPIQKEVIGMYLQGYKPREMNKMLPNRNIHQIYKTRTRALDKIKKIVQLKRNEWLVRKKD
jgi:RNA polymerase sigma factor (sigma-70 family)